MHGRGSRLRPPHAHSPPSPLVPPPQKKELRPKVAEYMYYNNMLATDEELTKVLAETVRPGEDLADVRDMYIDFATGVSLVRGGACASRLRC